MAQPVWVLSVDLQTKTATFQTGMADAAKAARGSFNDIKSGADEMGRATSGSMMEARHGVMLLGEEFGVHLPRALTSFIASIGPIGAAMEAAFPFLAIIVGATLLLEHLSKLKAEGDKLTESQIKFGTTVSTVLNGLDTKLLEAGIRADELNNNHLGALNKQLALIDHQSMAELVQAFDTVAKAADVTFAELNTKWFQWGAGSAGAKHALEEFKTQYDSLLAQGKDKEANDLLAGTLQSAERVLALQKQVKDNQTVTSTHGTHQGDYNKFEEAKLALQKMGIGYSDKEVEAQQAETDALRAQVSVREKINDLKAAQKGNATASTQDKMDGDSDKVFRAQADAQRKADEDAQKQWEENYRQAVAAIQESERLKIEATDQGSRERIAAIDAAIKDEEAHGLQETGFYRSLLATRVQTARQAADEEAKQTAEAGKEAASQTERMGQLEIAAEREQLKLSQSGRRVFEQERISDELHFAEEEFQLKNNANAAEMAALDKSGKDYENKLKAIQNKQLALTREHENQVTQIKDQAETQRNIRLLSAENRMNDEIARGLSQVLNRHESFSKMMVTLGDQVAAGMIQTAIKSIIADDMTKEHDAAKAARKAYLAGMEFPFPANIIMGPALGAMAFASVMAFEAGGLVPGVGKGDTVPAMLTPGETVLTKALTDKLSYAAKFGSGGNSGQEVHVHHSPTYHISAIDGASVKGMLDKHSDTFAQHFNGHVRKMNR